MAESPKLTLPHCTVDLVAREIRRPDDVPRKLTSIEARLLEFLAAREGAPAFAPELLSEVWRYKVAPEQTRAVFHGVRRLRRKLELDPARPQHLLAVSGGGYRLSLGGEEPDKPVRVPIPPPRNPVIGRGRELARIGELFAARRRLITIVGPPGVGKTALALEAGRVHQGVFPGGCELVSLAAMQGADAAAALAGAAGSGGGERLLVVDNAEHVVESVREVLSTTLDRRPDLTVLVTSAVRLELQAEQMLPLEPLAVEDAARLFVERAGQVRGHYEPNEREMATIMAIAQSLDCLPLAVELAAARTNVLTPTSILEASRRFHLRNPGAMDAEPRHRTLEQAIGWGWSLLSRQEQEGLAACTIFPAPFTLEAVKRVLQLDDEAVRVAALVDRSLLQAVDVAGERRFFLLETVRTYAMPMLPDDRREILLRRLHAFTVLAAERRVASRDRRDLEAAVMDIPGLVMAVRDTGDRQILERGLTALAPLARARGGPDLDDLLTRAGPVQLPAELEETLSAIRSAAGKQVPIEDLDRMLTEDPPLLTRWALLLARADAMLDAGRWTIAEADLREVLEAATPSFPGLADRARLGLLLAEGDQASPKALDALTLSVDPTTSTRAALALAVQAWRSGRAADAETWFREAGRKATGAPDRQLVTALHERFAGRAGGDLPDVWARWVPTPDEGPAR